MPNIANKQSLRSDDLKQSLQLRLKPIPNYALNFYWAFVYWVIGFIGLFKQT